MRPVDSWAAVGDRVRRARTALRYSQTDLGRRVQLDRTAIVKVESGTRSVSALELTRLAQALQVPITFFVAESPEPVAAYRASVADAGAENDATSEAARFRLDVELEEHGRDAEWLRDNGFLESSTTIPTRPIDGREDAVDLARRARAHLRQQSEPLGPVAAVSEKFGLYLKVVPRGTSGASLRLSEGFGVAIVGSESDPGRRRTTAAHELGHHLAGDRYNTDLGLAGAGDEREQFIDAFAVEFLLPESVVQTQTSAANIDDLRSSLIRLSADYRVSWSVAVNSARRAHDLSDTATRTLTANSPLRGDFLAVVGREPGYDLSASSSGPRWRQAVLAAYKARKLTPARTVEMVNGSLTVDDLPAVDEEFRP